MYPIIALLGCDFPKNDEFYRPFDIVTPKGTMVNSSGNAPVTGGTKVAVRASHLAGIVIDGAIRDREEIATMEFPLHAGRFIPQARSSKPLDRSTPPSHVAELPSIPAT